MGTRVVNCRSTFAVTQKPYTKSLLVGSFDLLAVGFVEPVEVHSGAFHGLELLKEHVFHIEVVGLVRKAQRPHVLKESHQDL